MIIASKYFVINYYALFNNFLNLESNGIKEIILTLETNRNNKYDKYYAMIDLIVDKNYFNELSAKCGDYTLYKNSKNIKYPTLNYTTCIVLNHYDNDIICYVSSIHEKYKSEDFAIERRYNYSIELFENLFTVLDDLYEKFLVLK